MLISPIVNGFRHNKLPLLKHYSGSCYRKIKFILPFFLILVAVGYSQIIIVKNFASDFCFLTYDKNNNTKETTTENKDAVESKEGEPIIAFSIAGLWESNIGWKYNIKQQGNKFTWTVINRDQKASGTINNKNDIQVSWSDVDSKGTAVGLILEIDPQGKATFIEWDNGVFFQRVKTGS